jgi:predicted protein tyrosine phosphatase
MAGKNILMVCSANVNRSVTAAWLLNLASRGDYCWSRGSNQAACRIHGGNHVTSEDLKEADRIICMEQRNVREIKSEYGTEYDDRIECLDIPDKYKAYSIELMIQILLKINL